MVLVGLCKHLLLTRALLSLWYTRVFVNKPTVAQGVDARETWIPFDDFLPYDYLYVYAENSL